MRAILGLVFAVTLAWCGYWFWGAARVQSQTQTWMSEQGASGQVSVIGFPNRFDLTITDPTLQRDGFSYAAPFFQVFAMTWKPWHVIAAFAPSQNITLLDQTLNLSSANLMASLLMSPIGGFALREVRLDGARVALTASDGWQMDMEHVTAAIDAQTDPLLPRIGARLTNVSTPVPVTGLGDLINLVSLDANLHLQAPLDATTTASSVLSIDIRDARLNWDSFGVTAKGHLAPDSAGRVSGDITITLTGAEDVPQILVAFGAIKPDQIANLAKGLAVMGASGQVTLTLSGGTMRIGPIPIGAAPFWPV